MANFLRRFNRETLLHIVAVVIFIVTSAIYTKIFFAKAFDNYIEPTNLRQEFLSAENGDSALSLQEGFWNPALYCGSNGIVNSEPSYLDFLMRLGVFLPFCLILLTLIGTYTTQISLGLKCGSSILGAMIFGFFTYNTSLLEMQNIAICLAISMLPYIVTGTIMVFKRKWFGGCALLMLGVAIQASTDCFQIMYYSLFVVLAFVVYQFVVAVKDKAKAKFVAPMLVTILAFCVAVLTNSQKIFQEVENAKYSTKSLPTYSVDKPNANDGGEFLTLMFDAAKGGESVVALDEDSETYELLKPLFKSSNAMKIVEKSPLYFGKHFFSNGPAYIGIIAVLLFVFAVICSKNKAKWWLFAVFLFSLAMSFGNIEYWLTKDLPLFYNYSGFANVLLLSGFCIAVLAALGIDTVLFDDETTNRRKAISMGVSAALCLVVLLIFIISPSAFGIYNPSESNCTELQLAENLANYMPDGPEYAESVAAFKNDYIDAIHADRITMIRQDACITLAFLVLGAAILILSLFREVNKISILALIGLLVFADGYVVNSRYIAGARDKEFVGEGASVADKEIWKDNGNFRVMNLGFDAVFSDDITYKKHNSVSGDGCINLRYKT
ncbi:MAG: hypothetical protein HUK15_02910, partial [Bacteroidales bacterium]|nr:hypothetical protein [Bacteroidales bacterium]